MLAFMVSVDHRVFRSTLFYGRIQCIGNQVAGLVRVDREANNLSRVGIQHCSAIEHSFTGGVLGDVGNPNLVQLLQLCRGVIT